MNKPRPCGCKGQRTCLICEEKYTLSPIRQITDERKQDGRVFCPHCNNTWPGWDYKLDDHPNHLGQALDFPGVYIQLDFITPEEEKQLLCGINSLDWSPSQSGRRKQNFGPKCNFKRKKIQLGDFKGFPLFSKFLQDRFSEVPCLKGYETVEQCTLEYDSERGASIDPHIDDCWVWGERIVTVSLLSDSVLTLSKYKQVDPCKYNLNCVSSYNPHKWEDHSVLYTDDATVRIPMPRRSLLVLYGSARYEWEHSVLREDIDKYRLCLTYREFTPPFFEVGGIGKIVLEQGKIFW